LFRLVIDPEKKMPFLFVTFSGRGGGIVTMDFHDEASGTKQKKLGKEKEH